MTTDFNFINKNVIDNIKFTHIAKSRIINWDHYDEMAKTINLGKYQDYIFMEWNALDTKTLLVRAFRTKYSYINHSSDPNVEVKYNPIRIETIKEIRGGDEILIDYNKEPLKQTYLENKEKNFLLKK